MSHETYVVVFLIAVFLPVIAFAIVALFAVPDKVPKATGATARDLELDEQLLAGRSVSQGNFISSSTAYMLQVSTTFYFVFWGYHYGLSNIWYLLSWALGLYFYSLYSPQLFAIRLKYDTLPAYLSEVTSKHVRLLAALACILSFLGVFYVEAFFCADFVTLLSSPEKAPSIDAGARWSWFFAGLVGVTIFYSLLGGMRKVVATDVWQLSFAYAGMAIVFAYLIPHAFKHDASNGLLVSIVAVSLFAVLLYLNRGFDEGPLKKICLIFSLCIVVASTSYGLYQFGAGIDFSVAGPFKQVSEPWGWFTLLGFTIINLLWQFCDSSNLQRISSLRLPTDRHQGEAAIRKAIRGLIVVSPLTWGLGILLGMLVRATGTVQVPVGTEYLALLTFLRDAALSGDFLAFVTVIALAVALISIMMSTADSAIISFMQVLLRDVAPAHAYRVGVNVVITVGTLIVIGLLAWLHKVSGWTSIMTVMSGVYSAILILAIPALLKMKGAHIPMWAVSTAIVLGGTANVLCTFGPGLFLPPNYLPINVSLVLPFYGAVLGSGIPTAIGYFFPGRKRSIA